jgi:hypothetical protein
VQPLEEGRRPAGPRGEAHQARGALLGHLALLQLVRRLVDAEALVHDGLLLMLEADHALCAVKVVVTGAGGDALVAGIWLRDLRLVPGQAEVLEAPGRV